jgi:hypothetical protein
VKAGALQEMLNRWLSSWNRRLEPGDEDVRDTSWETGSVNLSVTLTCRSKSSLTEMKHCILSTVQSKLWKLTD